MTGVLIRIALACAAACYAASSVFSLRRLSGRVPKALKITVLAAALALNGAVFVFNYVENISTRGTSFIPFVSVWQCLVFLALCFSLIRLVVERLCGIKGYASYFLLAAAIVTTGTVFMNRGSTNYPPALQSMFFIPHILFYMLSYSLAAVGLLIALRALIRKEDHTEVLGTLARLLFPFMTAGLFCGAVWADQVWGEFWAWDVKECWSLVTWLDYLLALHLFRRQKLRKFAVILMISGAALVFITFFFSNVLKVPSVHSY